MPADIILPGNSIFWLTINDIYKSLEFSKADFEWLNLWFFNSIISSSLYIFSKNLRRIGSMTHVPLLTWLLEAVIMIGCNKWLVTSLVAADTFLVTSVHTQYQNNALITYSFEGNTPSHSEWFTQHLETIIIII